MTVEVSGLSLARKFEEIDRPCGVHEGVDKAPGLVC